jgi:glycosyltransferase involved in cell wall biosynthesis
VEKYPAAKQKMGIVILGGHSEEIVGKLPLPVFPQGYVNDEKKIVDIYNSVDTYVLPSLEDNLPNTIMEAMSCGIPCVGFRVGGIPEMIDHQKNGYVANYKDIDDLAEGIYAILSEPDQSAIRQDCRHKVELNYSQHAVAMKYIEIYDQVRAFKHYRL